MSKHDFRPYVPSPSHPKIAAMHGHDAEQHARIAAANPLLVKNLFQPWEARYQQPIIGITTDGKVVPNLYTLRSESAPTHKAAAAAERLLALLAPVERRALCFPVDAREWRRWNNTEIYVHPYGLRLEHAAPPVREAILALVRESLSAKGYDKTRDVMRLNHFLGELVGNTRVLGEWSYNFSLFGVPSTAEPWGWQLMGHHLALNCLMLRDQMVLTPAFMGAEPNYADAGPFAGTRLFEDEERRGLALMHTLSVEQRKQAILYHSTMGGDLPPGRRHFADQLHLGGAYHDNRVIPYEGVRASGFSAQQRDRLMELVAAYVEPLPEGPLKARMADIEAQLDDTHFCWIGGIDEDSTFYYRIQSPVVMIEFDQHSGVFLTNERPEKFHIHTLVRTPNGNDYGADLLRQHYQQAHQGQRQGDATHSAR